MLNASSPRACGIVGGRTRKGDDPGPWRGFGRNAPRLDGGPPGANRVTTPSPLASARSYARVCSGPGIRLADDAPPPSRKQRIESVPSASRHSIYLSEDELAAGAGALTGAAAGAAAGALAGAAAESPAAAAGLAEAYPSAYQPPPFMENAGAEMTRFSSPPQCGQIVISGSENF